MASSIGSLRAMPAALTTILLWASPVYCSAYGYQAPTVPEPGTLGLLILGVCLLLFRRRMRRR